MRATPVLAVVFSILGTSCIPPRGASPDPDAGKGHLITAERIRESGATNAWDALVRTGVPLGVKESASGEPRGLSRRGPGSIMLSSSPVLVVDEVVMADFRYLRQIPANSIEYIRILDGADGTVRYGTGAAGGVIVVRTRPGSPS